MTVIPDDVRTEILRRIRSAEEEHNVRVLLAIESGSRAWGFASPNSDYDARFIYAHPQDWYLSIGLEEQRDVIEYPIVDDIDLNGWDLRKALRLFAKSNPAFVEWIQSPIIYIESGSFATQARSLLNAVYSQARGTYHYRSMAKTNFRGYLKEELVPLKKYFYVLRSLLSVRWIERYGSAPPIEFQKLLHLLDDRPALVADIESLLDRKRAAPELGRDRQVPSVHALIEAELARLETLQPEPSNRAGNLALLDQVFHSCLREVAAL